MAGGAAPAARARWRRHDGPNVLCESARVRPEASGAPVSKTGGGAALSEARTLAGGASAPIRSRCHSVCRGREASAAESLASAIR